MVFQCWSRLKSAVPADCCPGALDGVRMGWFYCVNYKEIDIKGCKYLLWIRFFFFSLRVLISWWQSETCDKFSVPGTSHHMYVCLYICAYIGVYTHTHIQTHIHRYLLTCSQIRPAETSFFLKSHLNSNWADQNFLTCYISR